MTDSYIKPLPVLEGLAGEFYGFCKQGELRFQRCGACGKGRMEELKATPENILSSGGERNALTLIRYNVTYKCNQCGETLTRTESRK